MKKIQMKLRRIKDADVEFVSMVDKGANQIPYRLVKNEDEAMSQKNLDLSRIFKRAPKKPEVVAVAYAKGEGERGKAHLEKAGLTPIDVQAREDADYDLVLLSEGKFDDVVVIKQDDTQALLVANFSKEMNHYTTSPSFKDVMSQEQFFPSVRSAMTALENTMFNAAVHEGDVRPLMKQAAKDFSDYVATLVDNLPESALNLEPLEKADEEAKEGGDLMDALNTKAEAAEAEEADVAKGDEEAEEKEGEEAGSEEGAEEEAAAEEETASGEENVEETEGAELEKSEESQEAPQNEELAKTQEAVSQLTSLVQSLVEKVDSVTEQVSVQKSEETTKVEQLTSQLETLRESVNGSFDLGNRSVEDSDEAAQLRKSSVVMPRNFETA